MSALKLNILHVVVNEHGPIFADLIDLISGGLRQLGLEVSRTTNNIQRDRTNIVIGHTCYYRR